MRLFLLECSLIGRHKLYRLFLFSFLLLAYVTIQPFSIGENFAPMDAEHIWVRMLLEDSEQNELKNEYMEMELEENKKSIEQLQLVKVASSVLTLEQSLALEEQRKDLEEKNVFLMQNMVIPLSEEQKNMLEENAQKVLQSMCYTKKQILEMDTAKFQQIDIAMSKQEIKEMLDEVDAKLGGVSHFSREAAVTGENYRKQCVEIGGYNESLGNLYQADGSCQQLTHEEMLANYREQLQTSGYIAMFTPFLCDKLAFILCLSMAFLLAVFPLQDQGCTKDVIAMKRISALSYMKNKYFSMVCMAFLPCILFGIVMDIKLCIQAVDFGYTVNPFYLPAAICGILLPEILFLAGAGILASLLIKNVIVPFLVEAVFFGISVEDVYGNYGFNRPLIRFNLKANMQLIDVYLQDIIENRIFFTVLSGVVFAVVVWVSYIKKYGNLSPAFGKLYDKKEYVHAWIKEMKMELEEMQRQKRIEKFGRNTNVYQYLFQLGYKKGIISCLCLDIAAMVLVGEMGSYHLFQRFLPLNGIILFSSIGFAEQEGDCRMLVLIKDRIHIGQIQFVVSTVLALLFVWGAGKGMLGNSESTCLFVSFFTIGLGIIYSFVSKSRYGVSGGAFAAVMVYILAAVTIL